VAYNLERKEKVATFAPAFEREKRRPWLMSRADEKKSEKKPAKIWMINDKVRIFAVTAPLKGAFDI
jgi:hypothetical protein